MLASVPGIRVIRRQRSEAASRMAPLGVKRLPSRENSKGFQRQQFSFFYIKLEASRWLWHSHGRTGGAGSGMVPGRDAHMSLSNLLSLT